jgi:WhiB family redox-sensing transcriptional regulator
VTYVLCRHCSGTYDLDHVETVARYGDCTVYITPCCNRQVDDRKWVPSPAFYEVGTREAAWAKTMQPVMHRPDPGAAPATEDWRHRSACLDEDPELFFPIGNTGPAATQIEEAKAICRRCDVIDTCLRWALETGQDFGVWGGISEDERRALKRRNARARRAS